LTVIATAVAAIGIDLGDKDARYACLKEEGKFTEEGTVAMTPAGLLEHLHKGSSNRFSGRSKR